jgi:hypothetical protein
MSDDMNPRVVPDLAEHVSTLSRGMKFEGPQLEYVARARAGRRGKGFNGLPRPVKRRRR